MEYRNYYMVFKITTKDDTQLSTNDFKVLKGRLLFKDASTSTDKDLSMKTIKKIEGCIKGYWECDGKNNIKDVTPITTFYENGKWVEE